MLSDYPTHNNPPSERLRTHALLGADLIKKVGGEVITDVQKFLVELIEKHPTFLPRARTEDEFNHIVHLAHMSHSWACTGFNTFQITHGLAAALMLTDPGPQTEELMLPFPVFSVLIPPEIIPVFTGEEQVWGDMLWVYRFTGHSRQEKEEMPFFRWLVNKGQTSVWRDRHPENLMHTEDERVYAAGPGEPLPIEEDQISLSGALRLIRNFLSWMDATSQSLEKKTSPKGITKKKSKKKGKNKGPRPQVWVMGREVKLKPEMRQLASEISLGNTRHAPEGWSVRSRYIVRGHWRNQACGPGLKLRKRKWIAPHYKGPRDGEVWAHVYKAGEE